MIGHRMILVDVSNYIHRSFGPNSRYHLTCHPTIIMYANPMSPVYCSIIFMISIYLVELIVNYNVNLQMFFDLIDTKMYHKILDIE